MIFPFLLAFFTSALLTPPVARLAEQSGWTSPATNRSGKHPALSGGVTAGLVVVALTVLVGGRSAFTELAGFWLGFLAIMATGLVDDLFDLAPLSKLLCQTASALIAIGFLVFESRIPSDPLSFGFLLVWVVGIINTFNLLDNMDGLAAGVGVVAALSLGLLIVSPGQPGRLVTVRLAGSLLGFLIHNFSPARVFLGDAGSHTIGFSLAVLPLYSMDLAQPDWRCATALAIILLIPIGDTAFVTLRRILEDRPVYIGGRDHSSHLLLSRGFSEKTVVVIFYLSAILSSTVAYLVLRSK